MCMFDSVMVPCPQCGTKAKFRSKGGECTLEVYDLSDAPPDVMGDINLDSPHTCEQCGCMFRVDVRCIGIPVPC